MSLLVTGSLAFDHIMVFQGKFKDHILPEKVHLLNLAFNVDSLQVEYGGTAGNIAYNLSLLGHKPSVVGAVGKDFGAYRERFISWGLDDRLILLFEHEYTAQAFITTDLDDNQIIAFHPGAMLKTAEIDNARLPANSKRCIISPNDLTAMRQYAEWCRYHDVPFWFDPGQALNLFTAEDLKFCLQGAEGIVLNDYEWTQFLKKSQLTPEQVSEEVQHVLITRGAEGVDLISPLGSFRISAVPDIAVVDPTGAGDAFRAGVLAGLEQAESLPEACVKGCVLASFALGYKGTQNHHFSSESFEARKNLISLEELIS